MNKIRETNMWKWWCGGGVIAIAAVLGCATAVEFKDTKQVTLAKKRLAETPQPGREPAHNGGKVRMPVSVSYAQTMDSTLVLSRDKTVEIAISADGDLTGVTGEISGLDALDRMERTPFAFDAIAAGESKRVTVRVPAKSGSLVVRIDGIVGGSMNMSTSLGLNVVNPDEPVDRDAGVGTMGVKKSGTATGAPAISRDSNGQLVQPMQATEN